MASVSFAERLTAAWRWLRWYVREFTGEAAYDHYLEHHRREHSDRPVMSRREFERWRAEQSAKPGSRCC